MQGHCRTSGKVRPRPAGTPAAGDCSDAVGDSGPPARLFWCLRCRAQVLICSSCDRGQVYCADGCAQEARRWSQREAGRRYQASRRGRINHAARARRYRARKNNVTHQGSPPDRTDDLLAVSLVVVAMESTSADRSGRPRWHCHRCGRRCPEFVRRTFLRRRRDSWTNRKGSHRDHPP